MLSAIDRLLNKDVYRDTAEIMVKTKLVQGSEKRMAKAIANFIAKLPLVALEKHLSETELCSRFMYRFLAGLFDNPDDRIFLRWTEEWTLEANANALTRRRPDLSITKSCGVKWTSKSRLRRSKASSWQSRQPLHLHGSCQSGEFLQGGARCTAVRGQPCRPDTGRMAVFRLLALWSHGISYGLCVMLSHGLSSQTSSDIKTIHDQVILLPNATRGKSPYK